MWAFGTEIADREPELKKIMAEKDAKIAEKDALIAEKKAIIIQNRALLEEKDDMIGTLEDVIASSTGPQDIEELKLQLSLVEVEKELERRKARHFQLQVVAANAAKQALQLQVDSNAEYVKGLQALLETACNSVETALAQEKATSYQNLEV